MTIDDEESVRDTALLELLRHLAARQYRFITPTPLTHSRIVARGERKTARSLNDIFGWSRPFAAATAGPDVLSVMERAKILRRYGDDAAFQSAIRVSTLGEDLFAHSAYPTIAADAIFFGPDTYRFARFVRDNLPAPRGDGASLRCVDIGCGSGAGAISAARALTDSEWLLTDINPEALRIASINARHAGIEVETTLSDVLAATRGGFDLVICNPPYLADAQQRAYRHGGGALGRELSLRIVGESVECLNPGGRLLLYTGVAIVDGRDPFLAELHALLDGRGLDWCYEEIDPDVFGEELDEPVYVKADRIAAVGLIVDRR